MRILDRLREENGFTGGYTIVRNYVNKAANRQKEMFMPLVHLLGHAQIDFGEADGYIGGRLVRFHYFCLDLPQSILYDNTKITVAKILGDGKRQRTKAFSELQSHYLFEDKFGRPGRGNDKGNVEGMIGYSRRHFMVLIPKLLDGCIKRQ